LKPGERKACMNDEDCSFPATSIPTVQVINRSPTKKRRVKTTTPSSVLDAFTTITTTEEIPAEYEIPDIDNDIYVEGKCLNCILSM
jgi:hypothetical protein